MANDTDTERQIECKTYEFHARLLSEIVGGFIPLNMGAVMALEPFLMSIVRSITADQAFHDIRTIVTEKYEYITETDCIRSCKLKAKQTLAFGTKRHITDVGDLDVRLICVEVTEGFYDVKEGKSDTQRWVVCKIFFLDYEALFK